MEKIIKNFKTWTNLNEGVGDKIVSALDKFFAKTTTAKLATNVDARQLNLLNNAFELIAKNEINFIKNTQDTFLKSSTGVLIPVSQLKKGLDAVIAGKMTAEEFIVLLPAKLADGTEVKTVVQAAAAKNVSKNVKGSIKINGKTVKTYTQNGDTSYNVTYDDSTKDIIYVSNDAWDEINTLHQNATKN